MVEDADTIDYHISIPYTVSVVIVLVLDESVEREMDKKLDEEPKGYIEEEAIDKKLGKSHKKWHGNTHGEMREDGRVTRFDAKDSKVCRDWSILWAKR